VSDERRRQRFMEIVAPALDDALSLARWLTGNATDAEDVVQEAAVKALRGIDGYQGGSPRAWVLTIVRNTAMTWLARNRSKLVVLADEDALLERETADPAADPEATLIARADAALVHSAIAALPLSFREIIVLREVEQLSYQEIAAITALPVGTVMSRLSRARGKLAQALGAHCADKDADKDSASARRRAGDGAP